MIQPRHASLAAASARCHARCCWLGRKGLFVRESDADRKNWSMRGAHCEGWPVYHAVFDRDSGAIYAAAASEWDGLSIWRSADLGETWTQSREGLTYADGSKMFEVSSLAAAHGRVLVGVTSRTTSACIARTMPARHGRRSPKGCRPSSGLLLRRIRTTATPST